MTKRDITDYFELAAYALGYSQEEYWDLLDEGVLKMRLKRDVKDRFNVTFDGFCSVVDALLPFTPTIHHRERSNQIHAFVKRTNNEERPHVLIASKIKIHYSIDRLE